MIARLSTATSLTTVEDVTRARTKTRHPLRPTMTAVHPIGTPSGLSPNTGPLATAAWLVARSLLPREPRWFVELTFEACPDAFDEEPPTSFRLEIYAEEWGYAFRHRGSTSWIRVTDIPFVHGSDDHGLLSQTPTLRDIGRFIRALEARYGIELLRHAPMVRTSLAGAETAIADWARSL